MSATQRKVRSREDVKLDNQLWGVKRTLSYFLLVANNKTFYSPPQGLLFLVLKILYELRLSLLSVDYLN